MPEWKKKVFVQAIRLRIAIEENTIEEIINTYTKLTKQEKSEILDSIRG